LGFFLPNGTQRYKVKWIIQARYTKLKDNEQRNNLFSSIFLHKYKKISDHIKEEEKKRKKKIKSFH
jgi:hypothetical protein